MLTSHFQTYPHVGCMPYQKRLRKAMMPIACLLTLASATCAVSYLQAPFVAHHQNHCPHPHLPHRILSSNYRCSPPIHHRYFQKLRLCLGSLPARPRAALQLAVLYLRLVAHATTGAQRDLSSMFPLLDWTRSLARSTPSWQSAALTAQVRLQALRSVLQFLLLCLLDGHHRR